MYLVAFSLPWKRVYAFMPDISAIKCVIDPPVAIDTSDATVVKVVVEYIRLYWKPRSRC